jgi:hypothetical protein
MDNCHVKKQIRKWLQQRAIGHKPLPTLEQIRHNVGWGSEVEIAVS